MILENSQGLLDQSFIICIYVDLPDHLTNLDRIIKGHITDNAVENVVVARRGPPKNKIKLMQTFTHIYPFFFFSVFSISILTPPPPFPPFFNLIFSPLGWKGYTLGANSHTFFFTFIIIIIKTNLT